MSFPTTSVLDAFTRADENPLANSTWTCPVDGNGNLKLLSNQVTPASSVGTLSEGYWSASTFGPDAEIYVDLVTRPPNGDYSALWVRLANPNLATLLGYRFRFYFLAGDVVELHSFTNDAGTSLTSFNIVPNLVAGDAIGASIIGSTLTAYKRVGGVWSSLGTLDDSTNAGAGYIGMSIVANTWVGDNFGGGTVVTGSLTRPMFRGS